MSDQAVTMIPFLYGYRIGECAARFLQHQLCACAPGSISKRVRQLNNDFHLLSAVRANPERFYMYCKSNELFAARALAAYWMENDKDFIKFMKEVASDIAFRIIVQTAIVDKEWGLCLRLFSCCSKVSPHAVRKAAQHTVEQIVEARIIYPAHLLIVRVLPRHCHDAYIVSEVLHYAMVNFYSSLYGAVVAIDKVNLADVCNEFKFDGSFMAALLEVVRRKGDQFSAEASLLETLNSEDYGKEVLALLRTSVEVGMPAVIRKRICSRHFFPSGTPIKIASLGWKDAILLLYNLGIFSMRDIYKITHYFLLSHLAAGKGRNALNFYADLASKPRSLKDLSRLVVSDCIGCHADRKQRVLSLDLPMTLTRYVQFHDVIY